MSKIKELINDKDSILVFDIDGVLAVMEFGERNHFMPDEEWNATIGKDINLYGEEKVSRKMKEFLSSRNMSNIYVITRINDKHEFGHKIRFANKYYGVPEDNIYSVNKDSEKADKLIEIKNKNENVADEKIIMVDDTAEILNDVMERTNFSTAHISSFLDM